MHGLYIPSLLESNVTVTLIMRIKVKFFPITDYVGVHIKINSLWPVAAMRYHLSLVAL